MAAFGHPRWSLPLPLLLVAALFAAPISAVNAAVAGASSTPSPVPGRDRPPSPPTAPAEPLARPRQTVKPLELPSDVTGGEKASSSVAEGGLMFTSQRGGVEVTAEPNKPDEAETRESTPKERHASRTGSVVARKGVEEKIKPRKGVPEFPVAPPKSTDQNVDLEKANATFYQTASESTKHTMKNSPTEIETARVKTSNIGNPKLNVTGPRSNDGLNDINFNASSVSNGATSRSEITSNMTMPKALSHNEKHIPKPKPTVTTVDGPEIIEPIPLSRTKNPPLSMPNKIDDIVPVVATIVALPILGAAIFVLYRRGRDCWDKRHYRRMDFLIDGMYND